ncbi:SRPBCC family protein [Lacibacterium aquatile]|uniref:SRPBCC family protein n=1 Tax=Lacibacterium aquatile TaxID=1168082 RepID=A0ABW5DN93_9PROT
MPSRFIETMIDIPAPPRVVWDVLTDFASYPEWNPFIRRIDGEAVDGRSIRVWLKAPGRPTFKIRPRLTAMVPRQEMRWLGSFLAPGVFDGEHYFRLFPHPGGTRFEHGEQFNGMLVSVLMGKGMQAATTRGFEEMNEALSKRCELIESKVSVTE